MAAPTFKIAYTDGREEEIKMLPKAQIAYERETKRSLRDEVQSLTELYELVWYAAGRPGTFDDFIESLEGVESDSDEDGDEPPLD